MLQAWNAVLAMLSTFRAHRSLVASCHASGSYARRNGATRFTMQDVTCNAVHFFGAGRAYPLASNARSMQEGGAQPCFIIKS